MTALLPSAKLAGMPEQAIPGYSDLVTLALNFISEAKTAALPPLLTTVQSPHLEWVFHHWSQRMHLSNLLNVAFEVIGWLLGCVDIGGRFPTNAPPKLITNPDVISGHDRVRLSQRRVGLLGLVFCFCKLRGIWDFCSSESRRLPPICLCGVQLVEN